MTAPLSLQKWGWGGKKEYSNNSWQFLVTCGEILLHLCSHLWEGQLTLNVEKLQEERKKNQCRIYIEVTGNFHMFLASDTLFEEHVKVKILSVYPSMKTKDFKLKTEYFQLWSENMEWVLEGSIILSSWKAGGNRPGLYLF